MNILSYFSGIDPAAAVISNGQVAAYVEEERLIRYKHAANIFPIRAIESCLKIAELSIQEIDRIVYGWDALRYENGQMADFYERVNTAYPPNNTTKAWQKRNLSIFNPENLQNRLSSTLTAHFGIERESIPNLCFYPHHKSHAAASFFSSPYSNAAVLTLDGSGDTDCTVVWDGNGTALSELIRIEIPHSVGWFYSAITELLGFSAYDGEYKVMGLASYGRPNHKIRKKIETILHAGKRNYDYELDPRFIHHGQHTYSDRFTDLLPEHLGVKPRVGTDPITSIHEDIAFEAQWALEDTVLRLLTHVQKETQHKNLCISGGVGLNVKLNSKIHVSGLFNEVFPYPIPNDSGLAIGAALGEWTRHTGKRPEQISHVYWGPEYTDDEIEAQIKSCGIDYRVSEDISIDTAALIATGKVVAWFQGRMEAGPRALGGRSILADPRTTESRDRVNGAIKFREYWRPFCPSIAEHAASRFLHKCNSAPYMVMAFEATEEAKEKAPAIVHIDGTVRAQTVDSKTNPRYHKLLLEFEKITDVPVLLNTSLNIKGEAIVCSPRDALRTFWSTGIDALAIGSIIIEKPSTPTHLEPEDVIR